MESHFDDARARGWREQYRALSVGVSLLYEDSWPLAIGDESWEPVPGPLGVPQPVQTQFHDGTFYQLSRRWVRRVGAHAPDLHAQETNAFELAGQAIRHAAEDNHLPTPDPGAPIHQQIREVLEAFSAQVATFTEGRRVLLALAEGCRSAHDYEMRTAHPRELEAPGRILKALHDALKLSDDSLWDDTADAIRRLCGVDDGQRPSWNTVLGEAIERERNVTR